MLSRDIASLHLNFINLPEQLASVTPDRNKLVICKVIN